MTKELSRLIQDINATEKMDDMIGIGEFIAKFKKGIEEEPEKMGDLINAYDNLMKKSFPNMLVNKRWSLTFKNLAIYCFLADNNYYELQTLESISKFLFDYLLDSKKYGPAIKALINYLQCDENGLIIKIFKPHSLN